MTPKRVLLFAFVAAAALSMSGCRTLSSQNDDPPSGQIKGMLYYLPVGKITIAGTFEEMNIPAVADPAAPVPAPTASPAKIVATQLKITMTAEVEADERAGVFYATPHANYLYEDDVHVKVSAKHLLDTGGVKTEDKTVEIVEGITSLATQIAGARTVASSENRRPFNYTFRPSVSSEYYNVKEKLRQRGITLTVNAALAEPDGKMVIVDRTQAKKLGENGLLFRPAVPYNVYVGFEDTVANRQQFVLPDETRLYEMAYPRISFVKHDKQIGFIDGMLTDFHETTTSPILGFLGLPKAIIKAIVPVGGG
jgi:hypothetical protein